MWKGAHRRSLHELLRVVAPWSPGNMTFDLFCAWGRVLWKMFINRSIGRWTFPHPTDSTHLDADCSLHFVWALLGQGQAPNLDQSGIRSVCKQPMRTQERLQRPDLEAGSGWSQSTLDRPQHVMPSLIDLSLNCVSSWPVTRRAVLWTSKVQTKKIFNKWPN